MAFLVNLYTNPQEDETKAITDSWAVGSVIGIVAAVEESLKGYRLIPMATPAPYLPPAAAG